MTFVFQNFNLFGNSSFNEKVNFFGFATTNRSCISFNLVIDELNDIWMQDVQTGGIIFQLRLFGKG